VNNKAVSSGDHSFDAVADGKHVYCFSNEAWAASTKEVSFNVHGIVYVPESEAPSDPLESEGSCGVFLLGGKRGCGVGLSVVGMVGMGWVNMRVGIRRDRTVKSGNEATYTRDIIKWTGESQRQRTGLTSLSLHLVKQLTELLNQVKDEQSYIVIRERTHRNTAESTNGRVKWWSIFQLGVLIGEGVFQVWWLKRFFEVCAFVLSCLWGLGGFCFRGLWGCVGMNGDGFG
jgi:hypothetical protein